MRYLAAVLLLTCIACAPGSATEPTALGPTPIPWPTPWPKQYDSPKVVVLMHIWYKSGASNCPTVGDPIPNWGPWRWGDKLDDPCVTISGAPWLRQISSNAYPLTGSYDSRNPDIIRWQFRQMKAAGIDVAVIPVYSWAPGLEYLFDVFFGTASAKGILQIAQEEDFKVAIEQCGLMDVLHAEYGEVYRREVGRQLDAVEVSLFKDAYFRLDGRLLYWIPYPGWMSDTEKIELLDGTDEHPRNVVWIFRNAGAATVVALNQPNRLVHAKTQLVSGFNLPGLHGWELMPYFRELLEFSKSHSDLGMHPIAGVYVGFDERSGIMPRGTHPGRYGFRNGVQFMVDFLNQSKMYGADIVLIESWNEWGEGSTIEMGINIEPWRNLGQEPGLYRDANGNAYPHKYQDALRMFFGMQEWVWPQPPPCSALDPLMVAYNKSGPPETRCTDS